MSLEYLGELRSQLRHFSGVEIFTDAPLDNHGKGASFSPTDLLCASLASCMVTIMGIEARKWDVPFEGVKAEIQKFMISHPRKVERVHIKLYMPENLENNTHREKIEQAGLHCPVALSLHPDVEQQIEFMYPGEKIK